jgi:hypothetical protein
LLFQLVEEEVKLIDTLLIFKADASLHPLSLALGNLEVKAF